MKELFSKQNEFSEKPSSKEFKGSRILDLSLPEPDLLEERYFNPY